MSFQGILAKRSKKRKFQVLASDTSTNSSVEDTVVAEAREEATRSQSRTISTQTLITLIDENLRITTENLYTGNLTSTSGRKTIYDFVKILPIFFLITKEISFNFATGNQLYYKLFVYTVYFLLCLVLLAVGQFAHCHFPFGTTVNFAQNWWIHF